MLSENQLSCYHILLETFEDKIKPRECQISNEELNKRRSPYNRKTKKELSRIHPHLCKIVKLNPNWTLFKACCVGCLDTFMFRCSETWNNPHNDKPFRCPKCDYKCSTSSDLKKHERTHTRGKLFSCSQCGYKLRLCLKETWMKPHWW